jgi:uncharacterized circularly permuted ATP-grasp superfamily protein
MVALCVVRQIEETTIKFNAKVSSTTRQETISSSQSGWNLNQNNWWWWGAQSTASFSSQSTATRSNTEERQFSLTVFVRAVQDGMPGGMRRVLNLLEDGFITGVAAEY